MTDATRLRMGSPDDPDSPRYFADLLASDVVACPECERPEQVIVVLQLKHDRPHHLACVWCFTESVRDSTGWERVRDIYLDAMRVDGTWCLGFPDPRPRGLPVPDDTEFCTNTELRLRWMQTWVNIARERGNVVLREFNDDTMHEVERHYGGAWSLMRGWPRWHRGESKMHIGSIPDSFARWTEQQNLPRDRRNHPE